MSVRSHSTDGLGYSTDASSYDPAPPTPPAPSAPPSTNMKGWYTAEEAYNSADGGGSKITTDSTAIYSYKDLSGNGNHLNQASGSYQSLWYGDQRNGYPCGRFNSRNHLHTKTVNIGNGAKTIVAVLKPIISWTTGMPYISVYGSATGYYPQSRDPGGFYVMNNGSDMFVGNPSFNAYHLWFGVFNGTNSLSCIDDGDNAIGNAGSSNINGMTALALGDQYGGYTGYMDFAEMFIYLDALSSDSGNGLLARQYMNGKYNLGLSI